VVARIANPEWTSRLLTLVLLIGFPIALIITMVIHFDLRLSLLEDKAVSEFEELIREFGCRLSDLTVLSEHFKEGVDP